MGRHCCGVGVLKWWQQQHRRLGASSNLAHFHMSYPAISGMGRHWCGVGVLKWWQQQHRRLIVGAGCAHSAQVHSSGYKSTRRGTPCISWLNHQSWAVQAILCSKMDVLSCAARWHLLHPQRCDFGMAPGKGLVLVFSRRGCVGCCGVSVMAAEGFLITGGYPLCIWWRCMGGGSVGCVCVCVGGWVMMWHDVA